MKSISFSCAIALLAFAFSARPATVTYTPGTGVLLYPENFFEANSNSIVQAISGAFPGAGSGNASTNAAQGWSASQTFNAPVMFGPTNAVTAIAGKQDLDTDLTDLADGSLTGSKVGTGITADNITAGTLASNRLPAAVSFTTIDAGTLNATAVVGDASGLTGINATNITTGTLPDARLSANVGLTNAVVLKSGDTMTGDLSVPDEAYGAGWDSSVEVPTKNAVYDQVQLRAPLASPTLVSPTLNDTVTFEQTVLAAHSTVTNFVADPTVSTYQTINADLTTAFTGVRFLHATNVAAGRQTTVLVFAGTNAAVTVSLAAQFAMNTNSVALTTGQILPISFYGYGSSPTNVVATLGTIYTR